MSTMIPPVPYNRLQEIASEACDAALSSSTAYDHSSTEAWNTSIINKILQALIAESSTPPSNQPSYKFAVNSTIIQHQVPTSTVGAVGAETTTSHETSGVSSTGGRRGMHSATGAYWNNEKDGLWNYKYDGAESKGLDVVVSVIWVGI